MGKSAPSAPPAPDPAKLASAQGAANVETAMANANLNRVNQVTPYGNLTYQQPTDYWQRDPTGNYVTDKYGNRQANKDASPWTVTQSLNPAEQQNLDRQRSLTGTVLDLGQTQLGNISKSVSKPLDYSGLTPIPQLNFGALGAAPNAADYNGPNSATTDAIYKAYSTRLDPQFDRERNALETRLANQGITVQSNPDAYKNAYETFNQGRNDAYTQALASAVASGVGENQNAFTRAMAGRQQGAAELGQQFNTQMGARQQGIQEMYSVRNQPINELAALLGTSPGVANPQFTNVPQANIAAPDIMGANAMGYQGQMNNYNQQMQSRNAGLGALGSLAGAGLSTAFPAAKVAAPALGAAGISSARF